jgi:hypothetical protein
MARKHTQSDDTFDFRNIGGGVVEGTLVHSREDGLHLEMSVLGGVPGLEVGDINCWVALGGADGHADVAVFIGMERPGSGLPPGDFIL